MNIAELLDNSARLYPFKRAVVELKGQNLYRQMTFQKLLELTDAYARGLQFLGFKKGTKVLLATRPSAEFLALTFALFKTGCVPVLIDPGMGKSNLLNCIQAVKPEALIAPAKIHWMSFLLRSVFQSVSLRVSTGGFLPGVTSLNSLTRSGEGVNSVTVEGEDLACIVFTTGSTGAPKGVEYFHAQMLAQVDLIQKQWGVTESDIDFPIFPLFALFDIAWGITSVLPQMDPTKPASADCSILTRQILDQGVTFSIGSPALFDALGLYCQKNNLSLPSIRKILMIGAPVRPEILERYSLVLNPSAMTHTPYGATEALPVCDISGSEILTQTRNNTREGRGTCVGLPITGIELKIVEPLGNHTENPLLELPVYTPGEIVVTGPIVTRRYFENEAATAKAKITGPDGRIWHRMGDLGYKDDQQRIWFCGRLNHRVINEDGIYYSVCCEAIFNNHPSVFRSALVGLQTTKGLKPLIFIEPKSGYFPEREAEKQKLISELKVLALEKPHTSKIDLFLFEKIFPTDIRHNAKIFREKLAILASERLDL